MDFLSETEASLVMTELAFLLKLNITFVQSLSLTHYHPLFPPHIIQLLCKHSALWRAQPQSRKSEQVSARKSIGYMFIQRTQH